ncbi:hypothetical protein BU23DRAFT_563511 [Bimuria novae-zelandiae CBS 107.79]|uniref:Uncharacterized protein n=1 Tax=Bimuria novae-zelandiae CBS 107.79 TaxID=1447943 RepID=A0A6A5VRW0_9PLEO|nr:hypothetical protein BU23DRAFT_563511 [Bimuria novae-zelandiae CBS 107.79]
MAQTTLVLDRWKVRAINRDIFAHQTKDILRASLDTDRHAKILKNNLVVYLRNRLNKRLDADGVLVSILQSLLEYLTQELDIKDYEQRQDLAMRLIEGVSTQDWSYIEALRVYLWDDQVDGSWRVVPGFNKCANGAKGRITDAQKLVAAAAIGVLYLIPPLLQASKNFVCDCPIVGHAMKVAIRRGNIEVVHSLLAPYKEADQLQRIRYTVADAIKGGDIEILKTLVFACTPWNKTYPSQSRVSQTWMEYAYSSGSIPALEVIKEVKGSRKGMLNQDVVKIICRTGNSTMIQHYIDKGLLHANKTYSNMSPLIAAASGSNPDRRIFNIKTLLCGGVDVKKALDDGTCPMYIAARTQCKRTVLYLLKHGANSSTDGWPKTKTNRPRIFFQSILLKRSAANPRGARK